MSFKPDPKVFRIKSKKTIPNKNNLNSKSKLVTKIDILFGRIVKKIFKKKCYTCLNLENFEIECGHFLVREHWALRWEINNVRLQCLNCNRNLQGNRTIFEKNLRNEIGNSKVDLMISTSRTYNRRPVESELEQIYENLKQWMLRL